MVMTSPDGITWTVKDPSSGTNDAWKGVTFGTRFVAVGDATTAGDAVMISGPNDLNLTSASSSWTARTAAGDNDYWNAVTYNGSNLFVAVASGSSGDHVITSPDGVTWTVRSAVGDNDYWNSVAFGTSTFVAVGLAGADQVMTSGNGTTWTGRSPYGANAWTGVVYGGGQYVAVACGYYNSCNTNTTYNRVMTSPYGTAWTGRTAAGDNDEWMSVAYGTSTFVAVGWGSSGVLDGRGSSGDHVMTSTDGTTWTARTAAGDNDAWKSVAYGNGMYVAVGNANGGYDAVMTSPYGNTWTVRTPAVANMNWTAVTYDNNLFVAVASSSAGSPTVMTSPDGITWTARSAAGN
jgi:hypothetical protein